MSAVTNQQHSLIAYWNWLLKFWWLAGLYVGLGLAVALFYFQSLPRWYQSQVIFVVNPEVYNQGLLKQSEELVLGQSGTASKPNIAEPELRIAYTLHSEDFTRKVAAKLFGSAIADNVYNVRRHLLYFRYQNDRFHAFHWHAQSPKTSEAQLRTILKLAEAEFLAERQQEIEKQIEVNSKLLSRDLPSEVNAQLQSQRELLQTRLAMVTANEFRLLQPTTGAIASPNAVYPQRIQILLAVMFGWCALGVTILHYWLLRKNR